MNNIISIYVDGITTLEPVSFLTRRLKIKFANLLRIKYAVRSPWQSVRRVVRTDGDYYLFFLFLSASRKVSCRSSVANVNRRDYKSVFPVCNTTYQCWEKDRSRRAGRERRAILVVKCYRYCCERSSRALPHSKLRVMRWGEGGKGD